MNAFIRQLVLDKIIRLSMYGMAGIFLCTLAYLLIIYHRLPPYLPLFNQLPWGDPRLGVQAEVFLPLFLVSVFAITNLVVAKLIYQKIPLIARVLGVTGFLIFLITFIFLVRMTQLVL